MNGVQDVEGKEFINTNTIFIVYVATLNVREMFSVPESTVYLQHIYNTQENRWLSCGTAFIYKTLNSNKVVCRKR